LGETPGPGCFICPAPQEQHATAGYRRGPNGARYDHAMKMLAQLLIAAVLLAAAPVSVRAGDAATSIPGTAWAGPSASSSVGGAIVDRVWRLEIDAGRFAIVRLNGEVGAELGLYLFPGSARSVVEDFPLRSSARPGGTQTIAASLGPGTYYVNVNGRNADRAYRFTVSISLFVDPTPPILAPRLANGATRVTGDLVEIFPTASDSLSGVSAVRFRLEGAEWSDWTSSINMITVPIAGLVEGDAAIEVQAQNGVGLTSGAAMLRFVVDRTGPIATPFGAPTRGYALSSRPTIAYRFSEPMSATSMSDSIVVSDVSGRRISGVMNYDATELVARFSPSEPLELGRTYAVDLVGASDVAGNSALSTGGWSFTYLARTSIAATLSVPSVRFGGATALKGTVTGIPNGSLVEIERRSMGGSEWLAAGTSIVRGGAIFSSITPLTSSDYRVRFSEGQTLAPSLSATMKVVVRPRLELSGAGGTVRVRLAGAKVQLLGYSDPQVLPMVFAQYRCNAAFSSCTRVGGDSLMPDLNGRAVATWIAKKGYWAFRLKTAGTADYSAASTGLLKFRVP